MELYKVVWKKHPDVTQVEVGEEYEEVSLLYCNSGANINDLIDEVGDPYSCTIEPLESGFFMSVEMKKNRCEFGSVDVGSIYLEAFHNNIEFLDELKATRKRVLSNE